MSKKKKTAKVRKPIMTRANKVETPKTVYNRKEIKQSTDEEFVAYLEKLWPSSEFDDDKLLEESLEEDADADGDEEEDNNYLFDEEVKPMTRTKNSKMSKAAKKAHKTIREKKVIASGLPLHCVGKKFAKMYARYVKGSGPVVIPQRKVFREPPHSIDGRDVFGDPEI